MPNLSPFSLAEAVSPLMPSGSFSLQTTQSPRLDVPLLRGYLSPNQPSSITNISPPMAAKSAII